MKIASLLKRLEKEFWQNNLLDLEKSVRKVQINQVVETGEREGACEWNRAKRVIQ